MRVLSAYELLSVWEQGQGQAFPYRAQTLLNVAYPDSDPDRLATMTVGQRNRFLLKLREQTFGSQLIGTASCPKCSGRLELTFNVADVLVAPTDNDGLSEGDDSSESESQTLYVHAGDYDVRFRAPTNQDLLAISSIDDEQAARRALLENCLIEVRCQEQPSSSPLPPNVMARVVQEMERADTQANTLLALQCPECGHDWKAAFDVLAFFWSEITAWTRCILREVHVLASSYGWSETEILSMSATRRRLYLEMLGG